MLKTVVARRLLTVAYACELLNIVDRSHKQRALKGRSARAIGSQQYFRKRTERAGPPTPLDPTSGGALFLAGNAMLDIGGADVSIGLAAGVGFMAAWSFNRRKGLRDARRQRLSSVIARDAYKMIRLALGEANTTVWHASEQERSAAYDFLQERLNELLPRAEKAFDTNSLQSMLDQSWNRAVALTTPLPSECMWQRAYSRSLDAPRSSETASADVSLA